MSIDLEFIVHPDGVMRLGNFLKTSFTSKEWSEFRAAIAFVKRSGTKHIRDDLRSFSQAGGKVRVSAGIDAGGTSAEGLQDLVAAVKPGEIFVFKNANASTFHPKVYVFKNDAAAVVLVGSGNLTEGGLYTNYEASFLIRIDRRDEQHAKLLEAVEKVLDAWSTPTEGLCYTVDDAFIKKLLEGGHLPDEAHTRTIDEKKVSEESEEYKSGSKFFKWVAVPAAPKLAMPQSASTPHTANEELDEDEESKSLIVPAPAPAQAQAGANQTFLMTLQKTDVGVGQTTKGTSRRSPEIFIPLVARDYDRVFWGWPDLFVVDKAWSGPLDQHGRGKMDRVNVMVRLGGAIIPVTFWYNPDKKDLRMRSEELRSAGQVGDILKMERADGRSGFSYYVEIIPQSSADYAQRLAQCTHDVRNSKKRFGYL